MEYSNNSILSDQNTHFVHKKLYVVTASGKKEMHNHFSIFSLQLYQICIYIKFYKLINITVQFENIICRNSY